MPEMGLRQITDIVGGVLAGAGRKKEHLVRDYCFDTRQMRDDSLFFALRTDTGDGHLHLRQLPAIRGAAAVVAGDFADADLRIPLIRVDDPLSAARRLAAWVRQQYRRVRYIGVTGSAGKTTCKEFVFQILAPHFRVFRSPENWNNQLGLPFSLLKMGGDVQAAVFELAMSSPGIGEIDSLVSILRPDIAVVLNVFPVHLEFLDTIENVARAKSEILNRLEADDVGLVSGDFDVLRRHLRSRRGHIVYFGSQAEGNDFVLREIVRCGPESELVVGFYGMDHRFRCRLISRTHLENLFAAIVVCHHLGLKNVEIQEALDGLKPVAGRGVIQGVGKFLVIDETYNSNPEALKKMLAWVDGEYPAPKIAVVGDMLELGRGEESFHREAGAFFARLGFQTLVTVGGRGEWIAAGARDGGFPDDRILSFSTPREAGCWVAREAHPGSVVLFKASRGVRLELAIKELAHG